MLALEVSFEKKPALKKAGFFTPQTAAKHRLPWFDDDRV
jgi:hypothetical protein